MAKDWFRNETWSTEIAEAFQAKLKRARTQGPQCLYIQALTLAEKEPEVALNLLEQYFSTGDTFSVNAAYSAQAEAYKALGRYDDAIAAYRRALLWESTHPYSLTRSYLELPYLIAILGKTEHFEEAIAILQNPESKLVFPIDEFMYGASMALIYQKANRLEQAVPYAAMAIKAAQKDRSPFVRHPSIGLVGSSYAELLSQLQKMAS